MTYPAEMTFKRDRALTPSAIRLYHFLTTELDFTEARERKIYPDARAVGITEKSALGGLHQLITRGYLIRHGRTAKGVYKLTLAWSVLGADGKTYSHPVSEAAGDR